MDKARQKDKAARFLKLHHDPALLVLPNIWDPLGARMLQAEGFPAVATASAAISYSLGYNDGENVVFDVMLETIRRIAAGIDVPLTADIECGYAEDPEALARNVGRVIEAGAVGINIEDSMSERGPLRPVDAQCERIRAARAAAAEAGIPIVINARTDVFLSRVGDTHDDRVRETIDRAGAYLDAGADCIYPITAGDIDTLGRILEATGARLNVYAAPGAAPMRELEELGIARLSLGPWLLKASLTRMREVARGLKNYESYELYTKDAISSETIVRYVSKERMKD